MDILSKSSEVHARRSAALQIQRIRPKSTSLTRYSPLCTIFERIA